MSTRLRWKWAPKAAKRSLACWLAATTPRCCRVGSDLKLRASVPLQRIFTAIQYDYGTLYPPDSHVGGVDQTHNLNLSATYTVNPRLALSLNENYISSLQPGLVLDLHGN